MKKGFTLIELLGVIVILSIIALIVTPLVANSINDSKDKISKAQCDAIKSAAISYTNKYGYMLESKKKCDLKISDDCVVTIDDLKKEGLLDNEIIKDINDKSTITINLPNSSYTYTIQGCQ